MTGAALLCECVYVDTCGYCVKDNDDGGIYVDDWKEWFHVDYTQSTGMVNAVDVDDNDCLFHLGDVICSLERLY